MHYHCEIVMPPTMDIEAAVTSILKPYNEQPSEEDAEDEDIEYTSRRHGFWDFWVIGGRWAGHKLMARYDQAKLDEFHDWMRAEKLTVSGVQFGKQELSPASQIGKVDAKWNEMFPSPEFVPCPIFRHSNDQFGKGLRGTLPNDVMPLRDVPNSLKCSRIIFAVPKWNSKDSARTGPDLEAGFMLADTAWNGCNHMPIDWDGKFSSAVEKYRESLKNYKEEYAAKVSPTDEWLAVTVDYHS